MSKVHQKEVNKNIFAARTSFHRIFRSSEERPTPKVLSGVVDPVELVCSNNGGRRSTECDLYLQNTKPTDFPIIGGRKRCRVSSNEIAGVCRPCLRRYRGLGLQQGEDLTSCSRSLTFFRLKLFGLLSECSQGTR